LVEHGFLEESRKLQGLDDQCVGSGIWEEDSCSGSGCGAGIGKAYWVYHSGYSGLLHVVFGLHGLRATSDGYCNKCQMDKICGSYASSVCDNMAISDFEHLVFVFPSSSLTFQGTYTWSSSNGVTTTFTSGLENLATFMCGNSDAMDGPCATTSALSSNLYISGPSEVMIMGMSNGGGAATFGIVKYAKITAAVAVDFYGYQSISTWLPANAGSSLPFLKIYTACDSAFYEDAGITTGSVTFATVYGLTEGAQYSVAYPAAGASPAWFIETPYTSADSKFYFAVHGGASCNSVDCTICHDGKAEQKSQPNWSCNGGQVHTWINNYADYANDALEWVFDPSPPPSPPAGTTVFPVAPSKPSKPSIGSGKPDKGPKKKLPMITSMPAVPLGPPPTLGKFPAALKPNKKVPSMKELSDEEKYPFGKPTFSFRMPRRSFF
jgi:hypothetical protein